MSSGDRRALTSTDALSRRVAQDRIPSATPCEDGTSAWAGADVLLGRDAEQAVLAEVVSAARQGRSRAMVLRGEPGVGKTTLLNAAIEAASGCRVLRTSGFESELPGAFAGLHGLCEPMLDRLDHLAPPQRNALQSAFGLAAGEPPNVFLIGLAVLGLLSDFGSSGPVVCVVDDAQSLDAEPTQVIAFVARQLQAEHTVEITGMEAGRARVHHLKRGTLITPHPLPPAGVRRTASSERAGE